MTSIDAFEKTRVHHLSKMRALQQKKIFTNWVNAQLELADQMACEEPLIGSYLRGGISVSNIEAHLALIFKANESSNRVEDLYKDLSDGRVLLRLLEFFTGRKVTLSRGTMRVHSLENVSKALDQMKQMNIHPENIGPIDIVDGNVHLILGLIWTFILNFQLSHPPFTHHLKRESPAEMKNALLRWCQLKTALYPQINVANFTSSWSDGLAMCALLHRHRPYLIDFAALASAATSPISRLSKAFALAKKAFRIPTIVNPVDFIACSNDERCVVAVVATWYYRLNEDQKLKKSSSRLAIVIDRVVKFERRMVEYVKEVYILRRWMQANLEYLAELSKLKNVKVISTKLAHWRENEKETKVKDLRHIELAWFHLRTQNLAWGYFSPSLPPRFDYPTVYRTWVQFDEAEAACAEQIRQGQKVQSQKKQLLDKFYKKAKLHKLWLLECDHLVDLAAKSDSRGVQTSLQTWHSETQISTKLLRQQRGLIQRRFQRNAAMMADAKAHHNQKMQILLNLRSYDDIFCQIYKRWSVLIEKFHKRETFLLKRLTCLDRLLELVDLTEELEIIWTQLLAECPTKNCITIWENKCNAAVEKVSNISFDWSFIIQTRSECIVGCCYARFWGVNLAIECTLLCYKRFFLKISKFSDLYREISKDLITVKDRREDIRVSLELIEQTPISMFNNKSIDVFVSNLNKLKLLILEVGRQSNDFGLPDKCAADKVLKYHYQRVRPLRRVTNLPKSLLTRRTRSLDTRSEGSTECESLRKRRNSILIRIHQDFHPHHLTSLNAIRQLKASIQQKLILRKDELEAKSTMLSKEKEKLHRELSALKTVVDVLSSVPEIQAETNEIMGWIQYKLAQFIEIPVPDVLTELFEDIDGSNNSWWKDLFCKNTVFLMHLHIQSRIRQKSMVLKKISEFRGALEELEQRFLSTVGVNLEVQLSKDSARIFQRIAAQTQATICAELSELRRSLNEINQEAMRRYEQLLAEGIKIHAIQRCCELLQWIHRSRKCLLEIDTPFLQLSIEASNEFSALEAKEPFLVTLEKEVEFHTQNSLPILHNFQACLHSDSSWNTLLEYTYNAWNDLIHLTKMKHLSINTAKRLLHLSEDLNDTRIWVEHKKELLLTTGETKNTMREMIRMECRMNGWETDLTALRERVSQVFKEIDALDIALEELRSPLSAESGSEVAVREAKVIMEEISRELHADWDEFVGLLDEYQKRLEVSLAFQSMLQELDAMNATLMSKHNILTSLELPSSIIEIDAQMEVFRAITIELEALSDKLEDLLVNGKNLAASQEEIVAATVTERLDTLKREWSDLLVLCNHQLGSLAHQRDIKVLLHDIEGLNASLSRKENQIVQTDYLPTIEHIRGKIMTQKQVLITIKALSDQVRLLQLKSDEHKYSKKCNARVRTVAARCAKIQEKAANVLRLLEFRLVEKEKLNQLKSIDEWILERQATATAQFIATDAPLQEQKAIQKYHLFRNFEAEVKSYGSLANEAFQNAQLTIEKNQSSSAFLQEALDGSMKLWNELNTTLIVQGGKLVEVYRAIIISEGCEELLEWLKGAAVKIFGLQNYDYKKTADPSLQSPTPASVSTTSLLADSSKQGPLPRLKQRSISETCLHLLTTGGVNCADTFDPSALNAAAVKMGELMSQMRTKCSFFKELKQHYQCLVGNADKFVQHEERLRNVDAQLNKVKKWLLTCALSIATHRKVINTLRTLGDENQWLAQKQTQLNSEYTSLSLLEVQKSLIRHQNVTTEVEHRNFRNSSIVKMAMGWLRLDEVLKAQVHAQACCLAFIRSHQDLWKEIFTKTSELVFRQAVVQRELGLRRLALHHWQAWFVQHMDLLELYNWLTETESTVMAECHAARGLASAHAAIKKHSVVEVIVSKFQAPRLRHLGIRTTNLLFAIAEMIATEQKKLLRCVKIAAFLGNADSTTKAKVYRHKLRRRIHTLERSGAKLLSMQTSVQKLFTDLRDLVMEKKHRLFELLALNRLYEEVSDVEEWVWSRTEKALIDNTGRDLDEWVHLQRDFCDFRRSLIRDEVTDQVVHEDLTSTPVLPDDFALLGQLPPLPDSPDRLIRAIMVCRQMISLKHSDSPQIAQWHDRLNEAWYELRELLRTRGELLKTAGHRLLFLHRCEETMTDLHEKMNSLPAILGTDLEVLARQRRQHANFRRSVIPIGKRVNWVVRASNFLLPLYEDVKAAEIKTQRLHLLAAWDQLNAAVEVRSQLLQGAEALSKWLSWLSESLNWIASAQSIISSAQKHEVQELKTDHEGKLIQHELSGIMAQHKQLWGEICTWESSIQLHCGEAAIASICNNILESAGFEILPTFTGIRKILSRSIAQLKSDWYIMSSTRSSAASVMQKFLSTSLCGIKPMLPSHIMRSGAALLIIHFHQLKIAWWRYWRHLEALTAKLNLLRDLRNLETWLNSMEGSECRTDLGSSLEETIVLAEEHNKFSQVVAIQGEKCQRLAEFKMVQLEESDPGWEAAMEDRMMEDLERFNILSKTWSISNTVVLATDSLQEDVKPFENAVFEPMEGVLYRKLLNRRYSDGMVTAERWQKCFAQLKSNTVTLRVLNISGCPAVKRSLISENVEVDLGLPLCRQMVADLVEQRILDTGLFKIRNLATGECHIFKAETRALAERWVTALNIKCSESPNKEGREQGLVHAEGTKAQPSSKSPTPTRKAQSTTCLPILRLIGKRSGQSHQTRRLRYLQQRHRHHSGSSISTMGEETERDTEMACTSSLSHHTALSSLGTSKTSSSKQSRAVVALTLPLRILYRRAMWHHNLPVSVSHHSRLSINALLGFGNGGGNDGCIVAISDGKSSLSSPFENNNSDADIDDVDEFS